MLWRGEAADLGGVICVGLTEKVARKPRLEFVGEMRQEAICGENVPGRGRNKCKGRTTAGQAKTRTGGPRSWEDGGCAWEEMRSERNWALEATVRAQNSLSDGQPCKVDLKSGRL